MKHQTGLMNHLIATYETHRERTGKLPSRLALGRWDVRELSHLASKGASLNGVNVTARDMVGWAFDGEGYVRILDTPVQVDFRIGRMPGAFWWSE